MTVKKMTTQWPSIYKNLKYGIRKKQAKTYARNIIKYKDKNRFLYYHRFLAGK